MTGSTLTTPTGIDAGLGLAELAARLPAATAVRPALRRHVAAGNSANRGNFNSFIENKGNFNSFISGNFNSFIGPSR
ncbi:hypothetical protein OHA40_14095 [Nocardia sp. NBC_00508]|uniref:hypothetical protein n=1 Tax=Nocardia sp. NBC_00508 TaxID=2975992 RepID=UPI002E8034AD|nr:hypothetical protein [Nocardia sp. NBC_00508]WUD69154.1 hypothetical protein OHA40_14095 [Nocardia sp. NBC_00508]